MEGEDFPLLGANVALEQEDGLVPALKGGQQLLLVILEELYLLEKDGEHALVFIVLNLQLVVLDPGLVVPERTFYLEHVLLVGVDELALLPLEHRVDFVLQVEGELVESPHLLLDLLHVVLNHSRLTLYL